MTLLIVSNDGFADSDVEQTSGEEDVDALGKKSEAAASSDDGSFATLMRTLNSMDFTGDEEVSIE